MENLNTEIRSRILDFLKAQRRGASSSDIAKAIGHSRITVTKYLEIMRAHRLISCEDIAQARIWSMKERADQPTILIVDDEPYVVDLVALSLLPGRYNLIKSYSGLDALERVRKDAPDLIILDLMMPGMDGYEVCQKIKENALTQHIPVMILSAKGEHKDKLKGMRLGADEYITKPFDPMELEARVDQALRKTKAGDMHSLTRLPGRSSLRDAIQSRLSGKSDFEILCVSIDDFERFCKKQGYKKGNDLLVIFSRLLSEQVKASEGGYLSHTDKDSFIVIGKPGLEKDIRQGFERMLPFFRTRLGLEVKRLGSDEIKKRRLHVMDVMALLGV